MALKKQVLTALRWTVGAKFMTQLFTWAITIIVIRLLTPGDYGLMTMAMAVIALLNLLNELGMGAAVIQRRDLTERQLRQIFGLVLTVNAVLYTLLFFSAPLLSAFFKEPRVVDVVRVAGLQLLFMGFAVIPQSLLERALDFRRKSILEFFCSVCNSVVTLVLAYSGYGVWSLVFGSMTGYVLRTIGMNVISPFPHWPSFNWQGLRGIAAFGGMVTLERVLWYVYTQADVFIIGRLLGKEVLGVYAVAKHLASLPSQKLNAVITQVSLPAFSRIQTEPERVADYLLKATQALAVFAIPVFWGLSAVAPELIRVALDAKWAAAILPMQLISLVMPLNLVGSIVPTAVKAMGRPDITVVNLAIASAIVPAGLWVGSHWGIVGVSIAWALTYPVSFLIAIARASVVTGVSAWRYFHAMARAAVAGAGMYLAVLGCRIALSGVVPEAVLLGLMVAAGVVSYGALSWLVNRAQLRDTLALVRGR